MKKKQLAYYLDLIKSALDKQEWVKVKRYGEDVLRNLASFQYSPVEAYQLYSRLCIAHNNLEGYSRALDMAYLAYLISSKNHLAPEQIVYSRYLLGYNFQCIDSFDKAIFQYRIVEEYYKKYGDDIFPMTKQIHFYLLIGLGYCYLKKGELKKIEEIITEKLSPYKDIVDDFCEYYHLKATYHLERKEYSKARELFQEFLKINERFNFPVSAFVGRIYLAVIDLLECHLDMAIKSLQVIVKDAKRSKISRSFCDASLILSKCYLLKNMPKKAQGIENRVKPILKELDIVWFYETKREIEQIYSEAQKVYKFTESQIFPLSNIIKDSFDARNEIVTYKDRVIIGQSGVMQDIYLLMEKIAPTDLPVLIQGETGTGKELFARAINYHSLRRGTPWLAINCGAVPETLLENELFGHTKGAFTDAKVDKKGYVELASDGTLFLDEIGDMPSHMQQKLLRVMDEKLVWRVGSEKPVPVNTRFIFASNQNIEELVKRKLFRKDLYYRINTIVITLPPLRDRKDDIPLLVQHFIEKYAGSPKSAPTIVGTSLRSEIRSSKSEIAPDALSLLMAYSWPGNVRELENEIEKICALYPNVKLITASMISESIKNDKSLVIALPSSLKEIKKQASDNAERKIIIDELKKSNGNITQTARRLGWTRRHLHRKITQLNIPTR
jgi:transcriptional regulator with PAS, ATPase and Fis domain